MEKNRKNKVISTVLSAAILCTSLVAVQTTAFAAPSNYGLEVAERIADEGIVLLKNENGGLPLEKGAKISTFGTTQLSPYFSGGGSGASATDNSISFLPALRDQGFKLNETLINTYQTWWDNGGKDLDYRPVEGEGGALGDYTTNSVAHAEMEVTDDMIAQAKAYSDTAVVLIGRNGSEGLDLGNSDIGLYEGELKMIDKIANSFDHVIVLFNICNTLEMGFLDKYDSIEAAAIIWATGDVGMTSVAKMLDGTVNPSGKLADTIAYSIHDYPSNMNFGDIVKPKEDPNNADEKDKYYVEYEEDIYVGYRYFETEEFGALARVQYPFGYGLSYTSFDVRNAGFAADENTITVKALVKNTGDAAGKEVVQVYYGAPDGKLEKPSKELVGFEKTDLLEPGQSQLVTITFETDEMASYSSDDEGYLLEKGAYNIYMGTSVRDAEEAGVYNLASDKLIKNDSATGVEIKNHFQDMEHGADKFGFTKLSKYDPQGTYPTAPAEGNRTEPGSGWSATGFNALGTGHPDGKFNEPDAMPKMVNGVIPMAEGEQPAAIQLKDVYKNPALMADFVAQFTDEELILMQTCGGFQTLGIERLGIPKTLSNDGPSSVKAARGSGKTNGTAFPSATMIACTWNQDLVREMGVAAGLEAKDLGIDSWYAPAADCHRNPRGGRNFEYFSEDPMLGGIMLAAMVDGCQSEGLTACIKHYAGNDQESNRCGIETYMSERAYREIYLKQFEMAVKGGAMGIMSAFNRLGETWCGASSALLNDLTRGEWGYDGFVLTDAWIGGYMIAPDAAYAGNDTMLSFGGASKAALADYSYEFENNPEEIRAALEQCAANMMPYVMKTFKFSEVIGSTENMDYELKHPFPFSTEKSEAGTLADAVAALEDLVKEAKAIDQSKYTDETVSVLNTAIEEAEAALADIQSYDQIVAAGQKLQAAIDGLIEKTASSSEPSDSQGSGSSGGASSTASKPTPNTGDSALPIISLIVLAGMAGAATVVTAKKRR
ncbi:beta-glucosidase [Candidatus Soleaferrea massiliensis]|uniref:beta-glucosidase n=1 Tax=Candidatus Soleaferrea massiliensis TaxID=1470354 RepID=UPI00058DE1C1|nr:glycoside hydrolase family 3 N-terminal domain-containing protein [Candidatus Soleaferrea massiliensis]